MVTKRLSPSFLRTGLEAEAGRNAALNETEGKPSSAAKELNVGCHHAKYLSRARVPPGRRSS